MSLMSWKVVARKKGTKLTHIRYLCENNLEDVKKQLQKDGYEFICLADEQFALFKYLIEKEDKGE